MKKFDRMKLYPLAKWFMRTLLILISPVLYLEKYARDFKNLWYDLKETTKEVNQFIKQEWRDWK